MEVLTVSQLNMYIKAVLEEIPPIKNLYITGEISNFKSYYQSGHYYFTLKDASSQLKCVMFSNDNYKLRFKPENGMNVVCFGQVGVYERDGVYQLYVRDMQPRGVGELTIAYEQLKSKLEAEGLFDQSRKKQIPRYPKKIGVATSDIGAAVEDIKNVITRRYPLCEIIICPTIVQGDSASADIVNSIKTLDAYGVDTIIVGRGGGSIEDLWAFNTEEVARATYECSTPIISAVGHETDYTIIDFVSDMRAPTPSAAAELAVPNIEALKQEIDDYSGSLNWLIQNKINYEENRLDAIRNHSTLSGADKLIDYQLSRIDEYSNNLSRLCKQIIDSKQNELAKYAGMLNALSPLSVLARGYSIVKKDDRVISKIDDVNVDDNVTIKFNDGSAIANIIEVNRNE